MSAGTVTSMATFQGKGDALCCATDNTNVFWGLNNGEIWQEVISSKALTRIALLPGAVQSMTYYNNILYVEIAGGQTYSVTTA